jgi:UDP-N-acetylmuramyl pentapeptide phosphotransferase/UDP-N-acetylglucosamine-1-phosphate transferase
VVAPTFAAAVLCTGAFLAALLLTALARRYALRHRLMDMPGERRSHAAATPRGGGAAIVAVVLPVMLWLGLARDGVDSVLLAGACGLALVAGIGWMDDHRPLSPWSRLAVHLVAAALLALGVLWAGGPVWWAAMTFVLALGLVNVWNFMDGINGIASTQAILVAVACLLLGLQGSGGLLACAVMAACAGFLPFNFPRARIFLGDVGSGALGYLVACLIATAAVTGPVDALVWWIPLSAFLVDAALTLLARIIRGERWWAPHVQHAYQRCIQMGHSHAGVTAAYAFWTLLSMPVAVWMASASSSAIIGASATWYVIATVIWLWIRDRHRRQQVS